MRICFIVGARPNFMKAAPVFKAFESAHDCSLISTQANILIKICLIFF